MITHFTTAFVQKYATFHGRASRAEYWSFLFIYYLILIALIALGVLIGPSAGDGIGPLVALVLALGWMLAGFLPLLGVTVRRLHDTGKSGVWYLGMFVPLVNFVWGFVLLVCMVIAGDPVANRYGPPRGGTAAVPVPDAANPYAVAPIGVPAFPAAPRPPVPERAQALALRVGSLAPDREGSWLLVAGLTLYLLRQFIGGSNLDWSDGYTSIVASNAQLTIAALLLGIAAAVAGERTGRMVATYASAGIAAFAFGSSISLIGQGRSASDVLLAVADVLIVVGLGWTLSSSTRAEGPTSSGLLALLAAGPLVVAVGGPALVSGVGGFSVAAVVVYWVMFAALLCWLLFTRTLAGCYVVVIGAGLRVVGIQASDVFQYSGTGRMIVTLGLAATTAAAVWQLTVFKRSGVDILAPHEQERVAVSVPPPPAPGPVPPPAPTAAVRAAPASLFAPGPQVAVQPEPVHSPWSAEQSQARPATVLGLRFPDGRTLAVTSTLIVGRDPVVPATHSGAAVVPLTDRTMTISKTHAAIGVHDGQVWIEDLHSSNGVVISGATGSRPIPPATRTVVSPGDRLVIGDVELTIETT